MGPRARQRAAMNDQTTGAHARRAPARIRPTVNEKLTPAGQRRLAVAFLSGWPVTAALALIGTLTGLMWLLPWWPALYALPVVMWLAGGMWWWARGPRATWQRAARGFAQAHVGACLFIDIVSLSGVACHLLLSNGWMPFMAGIGGIGGFYLLGSTGTTRRENPQGPGSRSRNVGTGCAHAERIARHETRVARPSGICHTRGRHRTDHARSPDRKPKQTPLYSGGARYFSRDERERGRRDRRLVVLGPPRRPAPAGERLDTAVNQQPQPGPTE